MTASAPLCATRDSERTLALVEPDRVPVDDPGVGGVDQLARLVVEILALAEGPVDPSVLTPAALVLSREGLIDCPQVTFGCNYDLDVRSFELRRGYARAVDAGWLTLRSRKVSVNPNFQPRRANAAARARATELYSLGRSELMRSARHHLLREAAD